MLKDLLQTIAQKGEMKKSFIENSMKSGLTAEQSESIFKNIFEREGQPSLEETIRHEIDVLQEVEEKNKNLRKLISLHA